MAIKKPQNKNKKNNARIKIAYFFLGIVTTTLIIGALNYELEVLGIKTEGQKTITTDQCSEIYAKKSIREIQEERMNRTRNMQNTTEQRRTVSIKDTIK